MKKNRAGLYGGLICSTGNIKPRGLALALAALLALAGASVAIAHGLVLTAGPLFAPLWAL